MKKYTVGLRNSPALTFEADSHSWDSVSLTFRVRDEVVAQFAASEVVYLIGVVFEVMHLAIVGQQSKDHTTAAPAIKYRDHLIVGERIDEHLEQKPVYDAEGEYLYDNVIYTFKVRAAGIKS